MTWRHALLSVLSLANAINLAHAFDASREFHGTICAQDKKSQACAKAKKWIRKNHPDMLVHERDNTVRLGIRARENIKPLYGSLRACVSCHVQKDKMTGAYPKITSQKHFCAGCHQKIAVRLDCFECHSSKPDKETLMRLNLVKATADAAINPDTMDRSDTPKDSSTQEDNTMGYTH